MDQVEGQIGGQIDYMEVMGALGGLAAKHPQTTSLIMQLYGVWDAKSADINQVVAEYQRAAAQNSSPFALAGIVMQLMAMHPWASTLLIQTLTSAQTRIPDLVQMIQELQSAANEAAKT